MSVTVSLSVDAIQGGRDYFRIPQATGGAIQAQTVRRASLRAGRTPFQRHEICGLADPLGQWYGSHPTLFRPPYGANDATVLKATRD